MMVAAWKTRATKVFIRFSTINLLLTIGVLMAADDPWANTRPYEEPHHGRSTISEFIRKSLRIKEDDSREEYNFSINDENESLEGYWRGFQQQHPFPRNKKIKMDFISILLKERTKKKAVLAKEEGRKSEPEFRSFIGLRGKRPKF